MKTADERSVIGKWTGSTEITIESLQIKSRFLTLPNLTYDIILDMDVINQL